MKSDTTARPVIVAVIGVALFSVLDAIMKIIASSYPLGQSTGMRYCAVAMTAVVFYLFAGGGLPSRAAVIRSFPRSVFNLAAGACFFLAIARIPFVDAIILTFLSPLFLAIWGRIFLGEAIERLTLAAISAGLFGVVLIARGQSIDVQHQFDAIGFGAAIATAALYALSMVITRDHSRMDSIPTLVLLPSIIGAIIAAPLMLVVWQPVSIFHYNLIACVGILGTAGFACLTWAYSNSEVNRLGLLDYTGLIWAAIFGYFIFSETPSVWLFFGGILIVSSCLTQFFAGAENR